MSLEPRPASCPFCGHAATLTHDVPMGEHWVRCHACEAWGPLKKTSDEAVSAWNAGGIARFKGVLTASSWQVVPLTPEDGAAVGLVLRGDHFVTNLAGGDLFTLQGAISRIRDLTRRGFSATVEVAV